jgi:hypothetical protein
MLTIALRPTIVYIPMIERHEYQARIVNYITETFFNGDGAALARIAGY